MPLGPSETTQLYVAGFGSADWEVIFRSAAITAMLFALGSAIAVLYLYRKRK